MPSLKSGSAGGGGGGGSSSSKGGFSGAPFKLLHTVLNYQDIRIPSPTAGAADIRASMVAIPPGHPAYPPSDGGLRTTNHIPEAYKKGGYNMLLPLTEIEAMCTTALFRYDEKATAAAATPTAASASLPATAASPLFAATLASTANWTRLHEELSGCDVLLTSNTYDAIEAFQLRALSLSARPSSQPKPRVLIAQPVTPEVTANCKWFEAALPIRANIHSPSPTPGGTVLGWSASLQSAMALLATEEDKNRTTAAATTTTPVASNGAAPERPPDVDIVLRSDNWSHPSGFFFPASERETFDSVLLSLSASIGPRARRRLRGIVVLERKSWWARLRAETRTALLAAYHVWLPEAAIGALARTDAETRGSEYAGMTAHLFAPRA